MNKKILTIPLLLLFINITSVSAQCTQEDKKAFKKVEDEYKVKYEYNKGTEKYDIYFSATKPKEYYYEIYAENEFSCSKIDDTTNKCGGFPSGQYEVLVVGVTETCDDVLKTMKLKLPKYNKLSEDPLCEGIEEFVLCNPGYEKEIDYESFVSRVNTYKKNKIEKPEEELKQEEKPNKNNEQLNKVLNFFKNNLIEIIVIVVFVVLVTITVIINVKAMRKRRRLE